MGQLPNFVADDAAHLAPPSVGAERRTRGPCVGTAGRAARALVDLLIMARGTTCTVSFGTREMDILSNLPLAPRAVPVSALANQYCLGSLRLARSALRRINQYGNVLAWATVTGDDGIARAGVGIQSDAWPEIQGLCAAYAQLEENNVADEQTQINEVGYAAPTTKRRSRPRRKPTAKPTTQTAAKPSILSIIDARIDRYTKRIHMLEGLKQELRQPATKDDEQFGQLIGAAISKAL